MITHSTEIQEALISPSREIQAQVEHLRGANPKGKYTGNDNIKEFTIERQCEDSKFFGFGVVHKLTLSLLDKDKKLDFQVGDWLNVYIGLKGFAL